QLWLAGQVDDPVLARRLREAAAAAIARVSPADYNTAGVSHNRPPVGALVFGHVLENARYAREAGRALVKQFGPDGRIEYHAPAGGLDLGRTHASREADGLASAPLHSLLRCASVSGDPGLIREGLRLLRAMDRFHGGVPRGAQT